MLSFLNKESNKFSIYFFFKSNLKNFRYYLFARTLKILCLAYIIFFIFLLCSCSKIMLFILLLEWKGLLVIFLIYSDNEVSIGDSIFIYFIVKSIVFLLIMWGFLFCCEKLIVLGMLLKLGFFPFLWWFPYIRDSLRYFSFFVLSLVQKLFPLLFIYWHCYVNFKGVMFFVILNVVLSILNLMFNQNNIKLFIAWSSNINYSWMVIMFLQWWEYGLTYYLLYSIRVIMLLLSLGNKNLYWDQLASSNVKRKITILLILASFSGFPPFIGFFYKIMFFGAFNFNPDRHSNELSMYFIWFILTLLFIWKSFIYINVLFKLNLKKNLDLSMESLNLQYAILLRFLFLGFYLIFS